MKRGIWFLVVVSVLLIISINLKMDCLDSLEYPKEVDTLIQEIDFIIVDSHNDTMIKIIDEETWLPLVDIGKNTDFHIDIPKMKAGKLQASFFAAFSSEGKAKRSLSRSLALINALYWTEANNKDEFIITTTYNEIQDAILGGKIAAIPSVEGAYSITEQNYLDLIKQYYDLGIKAIALNWNYSNSLGEGASEEYADANKTKSAGGLTKLGEKTIKLMNELGIIVDVSHMNEATFWGVINTTNAPIIASHSGSYTINPHRRNLKDDQLKAIAENGGVAAMVLYRTFVKDFDDAYIRDYVDHIDYAVNLIGIDHVGIGSDFDGAEMPFDMEDASDLYKIKDELVRRGYKEGEIKKLLGQNTLRLIRDVESLAKESKTPENIIIQPSIKMGDKVDNNPLLTAKVEGDEIDLDSIRVIVDGIEYNPSFNKDTSTISLQVGNPLNEKFHVVTFEAANRDGKVERETRIFYIEE